MEKPLATRTLMAVTTEASPNALVVPVSFDPHHGRNSSDGA